MKMIEDIKIKHLAAMVSQQVGKSVSICGISIDPFGPYFRTDEDGERIENSDYERCVIAYCEWGENFGKEQKVGFFEWLCDDEELIHEFDFSGDIADKSDDFFTYNWGRLQEEE